MILFRLESLLLWEVYKGPLSVRGETPAISDADRVLVGRNNDPFSFG